MNNSDLTGKGGIMGRQFLVCAVLVVFTICLGACAKLPDTAQNDKENLRMELAEVGDALPASWGKLISVSSVSQYPSWVQLWFQDNYGNVYMIPYNIESNTFKKSYRLLKFK